MVYSWRRSLKIPADVAGKVLEELEDRDGEVTPESLLEASRAEDAPLHELFEWDDTVAAEKYRVEQAGAIIRNIQVTIEDIPQNVYRGFVNVSTVQQGRYISIGRAFDEPTTRDILLGNALAELRTFKRKYGDLQELASVFDAIARAVA